MQVNLVNPRRIARIVIAPERQAVILIKKKRKGTKIAFFNIASLRTTGYKYSVMLKHNEVDKTTGICAKHD